MFNYKFKSSMKTMKMVIAFAVITVLASCGANTTKEVEAVDSTITVTVDTTTEMVEVVADSANVEVAK